MTGSIVCMYEPALTKQFYHGRTEAIRGATQQAKYLCETWWKKDSTSKEKLDALRAATVEHSRLTKEASIGLGFERHLFALKCIAERQCAMTGARKPRFFKSEAWKKLNHTVISTSNCGNPALRLFGFGPVVPDGFGIGYVIKADGLSYTVSSKHRQNRRYVRSLLKCLKEMEALLEPISAIEVEQRSTLLQVETMLHRKSQESSCTSYSDIWGENTPFKPKAGLTSSSSRPLTRSQSSVSGQYFATISERSSSLDFIRCGASRGGIVSVDILDFTDSPPSQMNASTKESIPE